MNEQTASGASIIKPLPPELINKIAAGEVIQRPASVVKELLDNAIDAGAGKIHVIIQQAGRTLIQVVDDGCGMSREDVKLCFQQHTTSKIKNIDDLFRIRTLGFRGEAISSIASISQVELKTRRTGDESGYLYEVQGGEALRFEPAAIDEGTSVAVRNLFYNVPARRQFLRTDTTEFRHILKVFQNAALSHTDIHFELTADTDRIYQLPESSLEERVVEIFGRSVRNSLIEFKEETSYVTVKGLLGEPSTAKKRRGDQFIFVNGRPVQHRFLAHSIRSMYSSFLAEKEYPFFALFLELDPASVDVNVHPAKTEIKFDDEKSILQLTRSVVKKALNQHLMVPQVESSSYSTHTENPFEDLSDFKTDPPKGSSLQWRERVKRDKMEIPSRINFDPGRGGANREAHELYERDPVTTATFDSENPPRAPLERHEKNKNKEQQGFWQLHGKYILTQTRTGLCVVDQHRAHKRIIYEKALSATEEALPGTQQLLFAQTTEFSAADFHLLKELLPIIQRMGFSIQLLSGQTAIVNGVPADIDIGDEQLVLQDMLRKYRELEQKLQLDARSKVAVAFASRTAIQGGKQLSSVEMETLVDQLFACEEPYQDPLGNPTLVYLPMEEIKNRFR